MLIKLSPSGASDTGKGGVGFPPTRRHGSGPPGDGRLMCRWSDPPSLPGTRFDPVPCGWAEGFEDSCGPSWLPQEGPAAVGRLAAPVALGAPPLNRGWGLPGRAPGGVFFLQMVQSDSQRGSLERGAWAVSPCGRWTGSVAFLPPLLHPQVGERFRKSCL